MNYAKKTIHFLKKVFQKMVDCVVGHCGNKIGNEGAQTRLAGTKRSGELPTSNAGSGNLWGADEKFRTVREFNCIGNEKRTEVEKTSTGKRAKRSHPESAVEQNDDRMLLEEKLNSCQLQLNDSNQQITRLESNAIKGEQVRLELEAKVAKMQQQLCKELEGRGSYTDGAATPFIFETSLNAIQTAAASFTKVFFQYARMHTLDKVNCALRKHFQDAYLARPGHVTYLLRAWTFETLFRDFENEMFCCGGSSIFLDETERRLKSFEYFQLLEVNASAIDKRAEDWFEEFRRQKIRVFLSLWQSSDQATDANLSIDALESPGAGEATVRLMESFTAVAKGVWSLHKLSYSFQTHVEIFRVSQETDLHTEYMDSVVSIHDDERFVSKVGFMICPGFRLRKSIFKCKIYLAVGDSSFD